MTVGNFLAVLAQKCRNWNFKDNNAKIRD